VRRILGLVALLVRGAAGYRLWFPTANAVTIDAGAPDALLQKETTKFKFEMVLDTSGQQSGGAEVSIKFRGDGAIDFKNQRGRVVMTGLPTAGGIPVVGRETVFAGSQLYMKVESCPTGALGGKEWLKVDLTQLTGVNLSTNPTTSDPTSTLEALRGAGEVTEVGREMVGGVETTHYKVKVDIDKALDQLTPERREQLRGTFEQLKSGGASSDVWIDDNQLPRRFRNFFESKLPVPGVGAFRMTMTHEYFDYGEPVNIEVPSEDEVYAAAGSPTGFSSAFASCSPARTPQFPSGSSFPISSPPPTVPAPGY
jgi:hypothetical protein